MTSDTTFQIVRIAIQADGFAIDIKFTTPPEIAGCIKTLPIPIADLETQPLGQSIQDLWKLTADQIQHEYEQGPPFSLLKDMFDWVSLVNWFVIPSSHPNPQYTASKSSVKHPKANNI